MDVIHWMGEGSSGLSVGCWPWLSLAVPGPTAPSSGLNKLFSCSGYFLFCPERSVVCPRCSPGVFCLLVGQNSSLFASPLTPGHTEPTASSPSEPNGTVWTQGSGTRSTQPHWLHMRSRCWTGSGAPGSNGFYIDCLASKTTTNALSGANAN